MVVAVGMNEVIQFCPQIKSREEFEVGGLDAEDKRRLLALGSCSTKTLTSHSEDLSYIKKDKTISTTINDEFKFGKESNNNVAKNEENVCTHDDGRLIFESYISKYYFINKKIFLISDVRFIL